MRSVRNHRPPFLDAAAVRRGAGKRAEYVDATCDFVASRPITINGRQVTTGESVDKSILTERRLRQMYETRLIHKVSGTKPAELKVTLPSAVGPSDIHNPGETRPPVKRRKVTTPPKAT